MTNLAALLDTWQQWSAHNVMTRALGHAPSEEPAVSALEALRDNHELVELLIGWQWQAMHAARCDGASWEEIGAAACATAGQVRAEYGAVLDRHQQVLGRDVSIYREVM